MNIKIEKNINNKKLVVALDIDGTLLSTIYLNSKNYEDNIKKEILLNNLHFIQQINDKNNNYQLSFARPNLNTFLEKLNEFAEIVIFTARNYDFALIAKEQIDPNNIYIKEVYNINNTSPLNSNYPGPKDLLSLFVNHPERKIENIVIVDDYWNFNGLIQLTNYLPIINWNIENINYNLEFINILKNDNCLLNDILPFLNILKNVDDVRPFLAEYINNEIYQQKLNFCLKNINDYIIYYSNFNINQLKKEHINRKFALIEAYKNSIKNYKNLRDKKKYTEEKEKEKLNKFIQKLNQQIYENENNSEYYYHKIKINYKEDEKQNEDDEKQNEDDEKQNEDDEDDEDDEDNNIKLIEKEIRHLIPTYKDTLNYMKYNLLLIQKYNKNFKNNIYSDPNYIDLYF